MGEFNSLPQYRYQVVKSRIDAVFGGIGIISEPYFGELNIIKDNLVDAQTGHDEEWTIEPVDLS